MLGGNFIGHCILFVLNKGLSICIEVAQEIKNDFTKKKINKLIQIKLEE